MIQLAAIVCSLVSEDANRHLAFRQGLIFQTDQCNLDLSVCPCLQDIPLLFMKPGIIGFVMRCGLQCLLLLRNLPVQIFLKFLPGDVHFSRSNVDRDMSGFAQGYQKVNTPPFNALFNALFHALFL